MNPLMQMMGGAPAAGNPAIQSIKRMMGMYRAAQNPQAVLQQIAQQNPMVSQIMQMSRGDLKDTFYQMCREKNVDPDDILAQLK